jgi:hypothetical protein
VNKKLSDPGFIRLMTLIIHRFLKKTTDLQAGHKAGAFTGNAERTPGGFPGGCIWRNDDQENVIRRKSNPKKVDDGRYGFGDHNCLHISPLSVFFAAALHLF